MSRPVVIQFGRGENLINKFFEIVEEKQRQSRFGVIRPVVFRVRKAEPLATRLVNEDKGVKVCTV